MTFIEGADRSLGPIIVVFLVAGLLALVVTPIVRRIVLRFDIVDRPNARRVNTGRFGLFTPESRDFFLQDASVFEFGGDNLGESVNGRPFFSRNIGLVNGEPVDIVAGGKLSGQYGGFGVGGLLVATEGTDTTDGQILSAARFTHPVRRHHHTDIASDWW